MYHCNSAGTTNHCRTCAHNPANQLTESRKQRVTPTIRKGECRTYTQQIKHISSTDRSNSGA